MFSRERRPMSVVLGIVLVVVLGVGIRVAVGWWTHPSVFGDSGYAFRAEPRPLERGTLHAGIVYPLVQPDVDDHGVLTLRDVEAVFGTNTAAATATVSVCRLSSPDGGVGVQARSLENLCVEVLPVDGDTPFAYGPGEKEMLVLTVAPTRPGTVRVTGLRLDYETGRADWWRRGEQTIRVDQTVRVR